ncbi:CDP-diacylglycerol--glycerol-3-phosphate 3-phosphatidyltransferase [Mycoplasma phocoenae]|uniref:CDP-diacylglycerol--glycerol-3-phosphate 3-phosphatidyltransferase n=1 Tax=Mycoplasma phocoenae TaxID=754517 RepID=A0A858U3V6_9MOLU|nr:CDP-diacylglycerol--glycerol-3-phosphate 3-phosphatidyltransferase [Mycoplasma phocoenae]QJG67112.1 CDP-diacylglycerol--glycerol-3-phosphate 3-phosphatidyltransferase [Mycoplasma phocoenae]
MSKKFNKKIPNYLTIARILFAIIFIIIMSVMQGVSIHGTAFFILYWINVVIFAVAMVTDFADGYLARKYDAVSTFGKIFDPIADKIMTVSMMLFLILTQFSYIPLIVLIIVRDIIVDGSRMFAVSRNINVAASWWGKIKTILVSLALLCVSLSAPFLYNNADTWSLNQLYINIPLMAGCLVSWISGTIYISKYLKGIKQTNVLIETEQTNNDIE